MSCVWTSWINQVDRTQDLDTVVYLGAGYGHDLADLLGSGARRIVLVEPNPVLRDALEVTAAADDRVTILPVAIAAQRGNAPFNIFNTASYGSLRAPGGLLDLLPGLRVEETVTVKTMTPQDLFQSLELAPNNVHALVLDIPGEDVTVIDALAGLHVNPFDHVMMCCTARPLYDGLPASADLPRSLEATHYRIADQHRDDPVLLKFWLRRDGAQQALMQIETLNAERSALTQQLADVQESADRRIEELEQERNGLQAEVAALTQQLKANHENAGQRIEALEQERSKQQTELATLTQQLGEAHEKAAQRSDALEHERSRLHNQLATLRQQMRDLRDADMDDLRRRYAELSDQKKALEAVLQDVTAGLAAYCEPLEYPVAGTPQEP